MLLPLLIDSLFLVYEYTYHISLIKKAAGSLNEPNCCLEVVGRLK